MTEHTETELRRDVEAIQIPSGFKTTLTAGTRVTITQALGGSYTIATDRGLARIEAGDADALGIDANAAPATPQSAPETADPAAMEKAVWDQLKTCYDPEIPVNIVDLGLIYDCRVEPQPNTGAKIAVKMTLTAPGCGMGPAIAAEARSKILSVAGVSEGEVELVWEPPWNPSMISEAGKMKLGML